MPVQIVMDRNGDTRHTFEIADPESRTDAERRFKDMTAKGFRAVALGKDGKPGNLIDAFEPTVETTLFIPHLVGG